MREKNYHFVSSGTCLKAWTRCPEEQGLFVAVRPDHPLSKRPTTKQPCPETGQLLEATVAHPLHGNPLPLIAITKVRNEIVILIFSH
jgi:hypothetical protein